MTPPEIMPLFKLFERQVEALERIAAATEALAWPASLGQPQRSAERFHDASRREPYGDEVRG